MSSPPGPSIVATRKSWPSSPDSPTADCPCRLSRITMSLLTLPTRTILATSTVSSSDTRRPPTNSTGRFSRSMKLVISGPPPWTTTGSSPTYLSSTTSRAKSSRSCGSSIAAPPYLTTTVRPWNSRMYGSASRRVSTSRIAPLVLVRIEDIGSCHRDADRPQPVRHLDRVRMRGEHVVEALVDLRRLVRRAAPQLDALPAQPVLHRAPVHQPGPVLPALRLPARHDAAGAVDGGVDEVGGVGALDDHRRVAHRRADEPLLTGEGRRAALAHHPAVDAVDVLGPGEVVMVVDRLDLPCPEDVEHPLDDDVAARIGVLARKLHRLDVGLAELGVLMQQHRRRVHLARRRAALEGKPLRERKEPVRGLVAEAARAEVDAHPEPAVLVGQEVDVVVAAADGAELVGREVVELALRGEGGGADLVEHGVVGALAFVAPDAERDAARDLVHDARDVDVVHAQVRHRAADATGDVVADAGRRDVLRVRDHPTDRLAVPDMAIGQDRGAHGIARLCAARQLLDRALVHVAADRDLRSCTRH